MRLLIIALIVLAAGHARASCVDEVGRASADLYVQQCLAVTTATRPPCNVANTCAIIVDEIKRGCGMGGAVPGWCRSYAGAAVPNPPPAMNQAAARPRPGFDCAKAQSPTEQFLCRPGADAAADSDRAMSEAFARRVAATPAQAADLRQAQRDFLKDRDRCLGPERGRPPTQVETQDCLVTLTLGRLDELDGKNGWDSAAGCDVWHGRDGSDRISQTAKAGIHLGLFAAIRPANLQPGDRGEFDVDGTVFAGRVILGKDAYGDPQAEIAAADGPALQRAMATGRLLRVLRNGKVVYRAALGGYATAARGCRS